jgi:hypothetical protein
MIDERKLDLVVLAALGALDGEDRAAYEALAAKDPEIQREVAAYRELVGRIGTATAPVPPPAPASAAARDAGGPGAALARRRSPPRSGGARRSRARVRPAQHRPPRGRTARAAAQGAPGRAEGAAEAAGCARRSDRGRAFRLVIRPQSRVAARRSGAGAPSGRARCGARRREAVLLASVSRLRRREDHDLDHRQGGAGASRRLRVDPRGHLVFPPAGGTHPASDVAMTSARE